MTGIEQGKLKILLNLKEIFNLNKIQNITYRTKEKVEALVKP
jgi:hypothetical protein